MACYDALPCHLDEAVKATKDNFSLQAQSYSRFRPDYPQALYDHLYELSPAFDRALDCATGNGQVAYALAQQFTEVHATDISQAQLDNARQAANIHYAVARAEATQFPAEHFDLITVGQAYHWFDFEAFGQEANRLLKPGGIIAIWSYHLPRFNPAINELVDDFYQNVVAPYWDPERDWVDRYYQDVPFHFQEVQTDFSFEIAKAFTLSDWEGYLNTWSAVRHYMKQRGTSPVPAHMEKMAKVWNEPTYNAVFPGFVRMGNKL